MATTYTSNAALQKPATSDRNWDVPINQNADLLDGLTAIGGLAVTPTEQPSATLQVAVAPGNFIRLDGTIGNFGGSASFAIPASSTVDLWLTDSGVLSSGSSFPTTAHLRLAQVVSSPTSISQIIDQRVSYAIAGTGLGFVLKAGDTMNGILQVAVSSTATPLVVADPVNMLLGFFGASPASQAAPVAPLTTSVGVASNTILDVGTTFSQSAINNNFTSLSAKVDALIATLQRHGLMGS